MSLSLGKAMKVGRHLSYTCRIQDHWVQSLSPSETIEMIIDNISPETHWLIYVSICDFNFAELIQILYLIILLPPPPWTDSTLQAKNENSFRKLGFKYIASRDRIGLDG